MENQQVYRSRCPINLSLETFGDGWSLLIVRDIVYFGKCSYGEFLRSDESISSHTLARRLLHLEESEILAKSSDPNDKRKDIYYLTEKGLDLIPILIELGIWGNKHSDYEDAPREWIMKGYVTKEQLIDLIRETVKNGGSLFNGEDSVRAKLGIQENVQ